MKNNLFWGKEIAASVATIVQQLVSQLRSRRWLDGRRPTMSTLTTTLVHLEQRTTDRAFAAAGSISDAQAQIAGLRRDINVPDSCD
jgi:hypothetical protein